MKKVKFFNPFIIPVILFLLITGCKKTDNETLPSKTTPDVAVNNTTSVRDGGIKTTINNSLATPQNNLTTLQRKSFIIPPPVVGAPFGGPPSITNVSVINGNIVTTPTVINQIISAKLSGTVNANYLPTTVTFEYGRVTLIGTISTGVFNMSLAAIPSIPLTGNLNTNVYTTAQPLLTNTTYQFRIKAVNSLGTVYSNPVLFTTVGHRIGEGFAGGIVFYIDNTGQHGLIATTVDQGSYQFDPSNIMTSSTGAVIGTGMTNTNMIISTVGVGNNAASVCNQLILNGYSDWFLPSQAELYLMYSNLKVAGLGNFTSGFYWSSTVFGNRLALAQTFSNGLQVNSRMNLIYKVRAARAF